MIDQTPDPWQIRLLTARLEDVIRDTFPENNGRTHFEECWRAHAPCVLRRALDVLNALAAERAQRQQEIKRLKMMGLPQRVADLMTADAHADEDIIKGLSAELAQRDETIRQLQDAFARCQEVQQATAETWRIEHDQMAEQIRLLRGAMAADDERLRRAAEQAGILYVSCDTAEALAEQITRLSAQVAELEAERAAEREAELADPVAQRADRYAAEASDLTLRLIAAEAERDAAQQREVEANNYFRMSQSNYDEAMRQLRAAQQQIATLTQELSVSRANHIDANQRNMQSVRELEAAEARCATLTAALEPFAALAECYDPPEGDDHEIAWDRKPTLGQLRSARAALQSTRPQEQP